MSEEAKQIISRSLVHQIERLTAERDALRDLLREASDWITPSSEADEFCARIDAALNKGGGDECP